MRSFYQQPRHRTRCYVLGLVLQHATIGVLSRRAIEISRGKSNILPVFEIGFFTTMAKRYQIYSHPQ